MKHVRMLGLAAAAAMALMAFVGASTASATTLTGEGGSIIKTGTEFHAVNEGRTTLTTAFKNIECEEATMSGKTTNETGTTVNIGSIEIVTSKCNCEAKYLSTGTASIEVIGSGPNGTMTSTGAELTVTCSTIFGNVHCIYQTNAVNLGTLTGSSTTGATATEDVEGKEVPRLATNGLCAEKAALDGKYKATAPDVLNVSK
jgi:hypothetical protein